MVAHANRYIASGGTEGHMYKINVPGRDPDLARSRPRILSASRYPFLVERVRGHVYVKPVPIMRRYLDGLYENPSNAAERTRSDRSVGAADAETRRRAYGQRRPL